MLTDVFVAHAKEDPGLGGTMNPEEFLVTCYTYKLIPSLGSRTSLLFMYMRSQIYREDEGRFTLGAFVR